MPVQTTEALDLQSILSSVKLNQDELDLQNPGVSQDLILVENNKQSETSRFVSALSSLLYNYDDNSHLTGKAQITEITSYIDQLLNDQVNEILHHRTFKEVECNWRGIEYLVNETNFQADVMIDVWDASKDELFEDMESNAADITSSDLFKKVYVKEYDQYGGRPYGSMIGLYEFANTPDDRTFLSTIGNIANAAHTPFIGSVSHQFFGCDSMQELAALKDLPGLMKQPKYGAWQKFRDSDAAAYIGLTLPHYISRLPYDPEVNPCRKINFTEKVIDANSHEDFLWSSASFLFARNLIKSFESTGWCQSIRGPKNGGLIEGLPVPSFNIRGMQEDRIPMEMIIPDHRELEFANEGFIPAVYRKNSADVCFFSCQSTKLTKKFKDSKDSEDSQLVANISYTYSITRIAQYVKSIMRDNIGSTADEGYIQGTLNDWLGGYVTKLTNPDDLTLKYYPFKATDVQVAKKEGMIGWYDCHISVLPHIQFEGMDVELKLDSRL